MKKGSGAHNVVVHRTLDFEDGRSAGTLPTDEVAFGGKTKVDCQFLLDILPVPSLPQGEYIFTASLEAAERPASKPESARFSVAEWRNSSDDPSTKHGSVTPPPQH